MGRWRHEAAWRSGWTPGRGGQGLRRTRRDQRELAPSNAAAWGRARCPRRDRWRATEDAVHIHDGTPLSREERRNAAVGDHGPQRRQAKWKLDGRRRERQDAIDASDVRQKQTKRTRRYNGWMDTRGEGAGGDENAEGQTPGDGRRRDFGASTR